MNTTWQQGLAIGDAELDRHHQELFDRLAVLIKAIVAGDRKEVGRLIEFLGEYVTDHFGSEERRMLELGYPEFAAHKAEHDRFMQQYLRYAVELERNGPTLLVGMRVENWISDWLRNHIAQADKALGGWLAERRN
jgi:hemerythrin